MPAVPTQTGVGPAIVGTGKALTVTLNEVPAVRVVGVPVLPLPVPGAEVSPGINTCSIAGEPTLTATEVLARPVKTPSLLVICVLNAWLRVTLNVP